MAAVCVTRSPMKMDATSSKANSQTSSAASQPTNEKSPFPQESNTERVRVGEDAKQALTNLMPPPPPRAPREARNSPSVLEEDDWTDSIETIVERDFFPELTKQKTRLQWLTALRTQDAEELRRIQLASSAPSSRNVTPEVSSLHSRIGIHGDDTPLGAEKSIGTKNAGGEEDEYAVSSRKAAAALAAGIPLDEFCNRFTSEDNASFHEIVQRESALRTSKASALIESQVNENLKALPEAARATDGFGSTGQPDGALLHWNFNPTNSLMYFPGEKGPSVSEKLASGPKKQIVHANTRLRPFNSLSDSAASTPITTGSTTPAFSEIGTPSRPNSMPRPQNDAQGGQWDIVRTPVIEPGADGESPFMTWGNIASTPLRLADGDEEKFATQVRVNNSHSFRINDLSKREKISRELSQKADRSIAKKRRQNSMSLSHQGTPTRIPSRSPLPGSVRGKKPVTPMRSPAPLLSDAGKKLAMAYSSRTSRGIDKELRSKYAPTPPRQRSLRTEPPRNKMTASVREPQNSNASKLLQAKDGGTHKANITDGLLQV